jgi:hypothetical protein
MTQELQNYVETLRQELAGFLIHNRMGPTLKPIYDTLMEGGYSDTDFLRRDLVKTVTRMVELAGQKTLAA